MTQCKCEHWQQCPVCMPHRFDAEGKLLPPEPTPLQSARTRIAELEATIEAQRTLYANCIKISHEADELEHKCNRLERQQAAIVRALEKAHLFMVGLDYGRVETLHVIEDALASVKGNAVGKSTPD